MARKSSHVSGGSAAGRVGEQEDLWDCLKRLFNVSFVNY